MNHEVYLIKQLVLISSPVYETSAWLEYFISLINNVACQTLICVIQLTARLDRHDKGSGIWSTSIITLFVFQCGFV